VTDLEILRADLVSARLPWRRGRVAALVCVVAAATTAVALAANHYLGQPAPAHVRATFARLSWWQPAAKVDADRAEVYAFSRHTVLYGAPTTTGGTCLQLVGARGFEYQIICWDARSPKSLTIFGGIANHGTASVLPPVAVTGRLSARGRTLEARTPDGRVQHVALGLHGFFSFEPAEQSAARRGELMLFERDAGGSVTSRVRVPAQVVLDAQGTPARRVDGVIADPRAKHVFFEVWAVKPVAAGRGLAQTGIGRSVDVGPGGRFSFTTPRLPFQSWTLSMVVTDARFVPLDNVDGTFVPDARFWHKARAAATRT
jgi:hypothetical protein